MAVRKEGFSVPWEGKGGHTTLHAQDAKGLLKKWPMINSWAREMVIKAIYEA